MVPLTTLRDRVDGRVNIDCCQAGVPSLFSQEEESFLVEHLKPMAEIGYGLTRTEVVNLATDYAISLHLREKGKELTMKWYNNFIKRWPELHTVKPSNLSKLRVKSASPAFIKKYFDELEKMLKKYDLCDKPHLI